KLSRTMTFGKSAPGFLSLSDCPANNRVTPANKRMFAQTFKSREKRDMFQLLSKLGLAAALCGLMLVPSVSWSQGGRARTVTDDAKMFSADAVKRANETIKTIHDKHKKDLVIETIEKSVPKEDRTKWAEARFNS